MFSSQLFTNWLIEHDMEWPCTPKTRLPKLDDRTFKEMQRVYPEVRPLREFRSHIGELKLIDLAIGKDDRNRCLSSVFGPATGRTIYSTSKHLWQPAAYIRSLARPVEGYGLGLLDYKAQEIAIAAAESGDERMIAGYLSGEAHIAFARNAGLVPPDATAASHP